MREAAAPDWRRGNGGGEPRETPSLRVPRLRARDLGAEATPKRCARAGGCTPTPPPPLFLWALSRLCLCGGEWIQVECRAAEQAYTFIFPGLGGWGEQEERRDALPRLSFSTTWPPSPSAEVVARRLPSFAAPASPAATLYLRHPPPGTGRAVYPGRLPRFLSLPTHLTPPPSFYTFNPPTFF